MSAIWLDLEEEGFLERNSSFAGPQIVEMSHREGIEQVLCVARDLLEAAPFTGLILRDVPEYVEAIFGDGPLCYMDRPEAEVSEEWVQLIPYCVVQRQCPERRVFHYRRAGSEGRLTGKRSLGVGGHVNPVDGFRPGRAAYERGVRRELLEEIGYGYEDCLLPVVGLIYDPSNAVGKVHLGLLHGVDVLGDFEPTPESALKESEFCPPYELPPIEEFETWSQLIIREFFR